MGVVQRSMAIGAATIIGAWALVIATAPEAAPALGCPTPDSSHFEVTNNLDTLAPPASSLRAAFAAATTNNGGTICIDQGVGTITLVGPLDYTGSGALTIEGNGAIVTGNNTFEIMRAIGHAVTVRDITISHGLSTTLDHSGGLSAGSVVAIDSTFAFNRSPGLFGIGGAIVALPGPITVTGSEFNNNSSGLQGGAIFANVGPVTVTNSTFDTNPALEGSITSGGDITLRLVTMVGTSVFPASGQLRLYGTVIVDGSPNCLSGDNAPLSLGYNYSDDTTCNLVLATDNQNVANDPMLAALANNGGPTATRLPQTGSPLIDAITPLVAGQCPSEPTPLVTTDQRGLTRPSGPGCEIGALEIQVAAPAAPVTGPIALTG